MAVKPFPWPAVMFDPSAIAAAAAFNLLLVFSFLNPTRVAVATIVREKELRLREGMRILGLKVLDIVMPQPLLRQLCDSPLDHEAMVTGVASQPYDRPHCKCPALDIAWSIWQAVEAFVTRSKLCRTPEDALSHLGHVRL